MLLILQPEVKRRIKEIGAAFMCITAIISSVDQTFQGGLHTFYGFLCSFVSFALFVFYRVDCCVRIPKAVLTRPPKCGGNNRINTHTHTHLYKSSNYEAYDIRENEDVQWHCTYFGKIIQHGNYLHSIR